MLGVELRHAILKPDMFDAQSLVSDQKLSQDLYSTTELATVEAVSRRMSVDLAMRCWETHPSNTGKEASRRELISPVIFAAALLAGEACMLREQLLGFQIQRPGWKLSDPVLGQ